MGEPAAVRNVPPPEGELAKVLENMSDVRTRILVAPGYFTQWLNDKAINVKSAKALGLNARVLEAVAEWWCPNFEYVKILTIDAARAEVTLLRQKLGRDHDDQLIYIDGKGIKILFNYGLRRFMSGQSSRDGRLDTFFAIIQKYWAWDQISAQVHANVNAEINNEEEADQDECVVVEIASSSQAARPGGSVEPHAEPATGLRRMRTGVKDEMPPPPVPAKALLPPLPREVLPSNPADLHPVDRAKLEARMAAIRQRLEESKKVLADQEARSPENMEPVGTGSESLACKDTDETLPYWGDVIGDAIDGRGLYDCEDPEEEDSLLDSQPMAAAVADSKPMAAAVAAVEDSEAMAAAIEDSQPMMAAPVEPTASLGEDSQPVEVEDSQPLTATVLEEDSQPRPETELDSLPPVFDDSQPRPETELDALPPVCDDSQPRPETELDPLPPVFQDSQPRPETELDPLPPVFQDSQPRPETELDVVPSVAETEVPCAQPDPPSETEDGEDKRKMDEPTTPKATIPEVPSHAKKPAAKRSGKPAASKTKAKPRQTGASQTGQDQHEEGGNLEKDLEGLKDLPMVTREHQQVIKNQKNKTRRMDDARDAPRGRDAEPKGRGRGRGIAKRPASRKPAKGQKQARLASPVDATVTVLESEGEETNGEECRKDLARDFEAAAEKSAKLRTQKDPVDTHKGIAKDKPDKRKRPSTKDDVRKESNETHGKARKGACKADAPEEMPDVPKVTKAARKAKEPKEVLGGEGQVLRKATFAGRYCPSRDGIASARFLVIRKVFEEKVEGKLTGSVSSCELKWWNFVFTTLVEAKCNDEELVLSKVNPFLALDDVRDYVK